MKEEQILNKAIEKAKKNGYIELFSVRNASYTLKWRNVIFSPNFAKAFWSMDNGACSIHGYEKMDSGDNGDYWCDLCCENDQHLIYGWQYFLQQMVLEENPIHYLEQFI